MNVVGWFEIYVNDMQRAKAFYQTVLQLELTKNDMPEFDMQMFPSDESYGAAGALIYSADVKAGGNSTVVYFNCTDCAVEESRVVAAGGSVMQAKFSIGEHGNISLVHDTEGNLIGLHSMM